MNHPQAFFQNSEEWKNKIRQEAKPSGQMLTEALGSSASVHELGGEMWFKKSGAKLFGGSPQKKSPKGILKRERVKIKILLVF